MKILLTGAAGFIGFHAATRLVRETCQIVCLDSISEYYDTRLKFDRLRELGFARSDIQDNRPIPSSLYRNLSFVKLDLANLREVTHLFENEHFEYVVHLAAQAGVRYSLEAPATYITSNIVGFFNLLEACRAHPVRHLIFASSSSVYGLNKHTPFSEQDHVDHPASLYAATKKSNELMAHSYSHLFRIPVTGLRFFTVYGPWGRPDMAYYTFTQKILNDEPVDLYNFGEMKRDFTYVDDVVEGLIRVIEKIPTPADDAADIDSRPDLSNAPYRIYNIGNNSPVSLEDFVSVLELALQKKAQRNYLPLQPGDVVATCANVDGLQKESGFRPSTSLKDGIAKFVKWYRSYHELRQSPNFGN